jgi:uncharacterized protein with FMN-binding domain
VTSKHDPSIPSSDEETPRQQARSSIARGGGASGGRVASSLVAIGSASVLAIYAAGYWRTRAAAERIERASARHAAPIGVSAPAPNSASVVAPAAAPVANVAPPATIDRDTPRAAAPPPAATITAAKPAASVLASAPKKDASAPSLPKDVAAKAKAPHEDTEDIVPSQTSSSTTTAAVAPSVTPSVTSSAAAVAPTSVPAPAAIATPAASSSAYKDGTYTGWGTCRHGDIQATVVVASGRITSAAISQCLTRYPCSWIEALPPQVVQRQSAEVDYVSGATQSADAFYGAVTDALSKAK